MQQRHRRCTLGPESTIRWRGSESTSSVWALPPWRSASRRAPPPWERHCFSRCLAILSLPSFEGESQHCGKRVPFSLSWGKSDEQVVAGGDEVGSARIKVEQAIQGEDLVEGSLSIEERKDVRFRVVGGRRMEERGRKGGGGRGRGQGGRGREKQR